MEVRKPFEDLMKAIEFLCRKFVHRFIHKMYIFLPGAHRVSDIHPWSFKGSVASGFLCFQQRQLSILLLSFSFFQSSRSLNFRVVKRKVLMSTCHSVWGSETSLRRLPGPFTDLHDVIHSPILQCWVTPPDMITVFQFYWVCTGPFGRIFWATEKGGIDILIKDTETKTNLP